MSGSRAAVSDVDVDLGQLFASVLRNWLRILVAALIVAAIAFMAVSMIAPQYRGETRILIESRESVYTRPANTTGDADRPLLDEEAIASQVEVIGSTEILRAVARDLNLASRAEFGGETGALGNLLVLIGLRSDPGQATVEERVLRMMRDRLSVFRVDRSRVIVVQYSSQEPQLAADVANAVADAYIAVQEQAKRASNADATEWLEPEIADLRQRVREAEARVAAFRSRSDLLVGQGNAPLATQELSEMSSELSRVRAARSAAQAKAGAIREALASGERVDTLPEVLNAPLVQRLRERQVQVQSDLADLSTSLLDNHPRMRGLRAQLAETNAQLRAEMQKVLASLDNEASAAQVRERQLVADVNRLKAASAQAGDSEVELRALEREAAAQRALLESYLTRYREAASRADRNYLPADARIFARATPPIEAYFPKTTPILAAAFVGSLLVIAVFMLLRELFSGRAMRPAVGGDLYVHEVAMPEPHRAEPAFAEAGDVVPARDAVAEEPRTDPAIPRDELSVAAAADRLVASGAVRAVFLSPEGDEASATSVMVAREVGDAGLRVVFLDLTYSGAPSTSMLDSARYPGITNLLAAESSFTDIIRGDLYSDCHVIPVGTADPARAMRAIDRLPIIMQSLATAYDMIVVECGPSDAEGIARVVGEGTEVLVSIIEPGDETVAETAANLSEHGYGDIIRVSPIGHETPHAPAGRSVA